MEAAFWTDQLARVVQGRRIILKVELLVHATGTLVVMRRFGAADAFVFATTGVGTGPLPDAPSFCMHTDVAGMAIDEAIHTGNRAVGHLTPDAIEALDGFDPDHSALVIGDFLGDSPTLDGRPFLAYRRPEWLALDDKTVVDAFWDRAGVVRAPYEIVEADEQAVGGAFDRLSQGSGVVLAVDATYGWTGGGHGTRPVSRRDAIATALDGWSGRTVRVTPFMEGVPCSIHGIVFADDVVVLRPVEMLILRRQDGTFFYCGCASYWDPPERGRVQMREAAARVGRQLRDDVAYRGAFTIDGVMTTDGFRPTELNPRNGAGLSTMGRVTDFPLQLALDCLVGGVDVDWQPRALEAFLLDTFDRLRSGGTGGPFDRDVPPGDHEIPGGTLTVGDSPLGVYIRAVVEHPAGQRFGPRAAQIWGWADERFALGLGPLTAAAEQ